MSALLSNRLTASFSRRFLWCVGGSTSGTRVVRISEADVLATLLEHVEYADLVRCLEVRFLSRPGIEKAFGGPLRAR